MLHPDSQLLTSKEKDIVMYLANSQSDGVRLRLRLTNRMLTSLSLMAAARCSASDVRLILMHCKDKKNPIPSLRCVISLRCMNEYADAHGTEADDNSMTSHLLELIQQKYPAVKGIGILNKISSWISWRRCQTKSTRC